MGISVGILYIVSLLYFFYLKRKQKKNKSLLDGCRKAIAILERIVNRLNNHENDSSKDEEVFLESGGWLERKQVAMKMMMMMYQVREKIRNSLEKEGNKLNAWF